MLSEPAEQKRRILLIAKIQYILPSSKASLPFILTTELCYTTLRRMSRKKEKLRKRFYEILQICSEKIYIQGPRFAKATQGKKL